MLGRKSLASLAASAVLLMSPSASRAGYTVSIDAPKTQASTVAGVVTETFNTLALGSYTTLNTPIGTYSASSPGLIVVAPDAFGGANQTQYMAVGAQSGPTLTTTLTLTTPASYFGIYWSAVDSQNSLVIFSGATPELTINQATILALVAGNSAYFGNPNNGLDTTEPFVYLNINTTGGSEITSIKFVNESTATGFESDNHSVTSVPEPTSAIMLGLGLTTLTGITLRRRMARPATPGV
jgi:hypothetical protein